MIWTVSRSQVSILLSGVNRERLSKNANRSLVHSWHVFFFLIVANVLLLLLHDNLGTLHLQLSQSSLLVSLILVGKCWEIVVTSSSGALSSTVRLLCNFGGTQYLLIKSVVLYSNSLWMPFPCLDIRTETMLTVSLCVHKLHVHI